MSRACMDNRLSADVAYTSRLIDELYKLKQQHRSWDDAWPLALARSRCPHALTFRPTELDPGTERIEHPDRCESWARFTYRVLREAFLDIGRPCGLDRYAGWDDAGSSVRGKARAAA